MYAAMFNQVKVIKSNWELAGISELSHSRIEARLLHQVEI